MTESENEQKIMQIHHNGNAMSVSCSYIDDY